VVQLIGIVSGVSSLSFDSVAAPETGALRKDMKKAVLTLVLTP
jgi:hypothetical protein